MVSRKIIVVMLSSLTLFACSQGKNASNDAPNAKPKGSPGVCEPSSAPIAGNIVGGSVVSVGDPDDKMVMILFNTEEGSICTAAAITDQILLTAAHCVNSNPKKVVASFYPSIKCSSGYDVTKYSIRSSKVVSHESYDISIPVQQRTADMALVFLESKIPEGYPIYQIADPAVLKDTNSMYLYGYGVTGQNKKDAGVLRKAILDSSQYILHEDQRKVEVSQLDSSGFCMGDSGGPALVKIGDQFQILGINSYVKGKEGDICNAKGFQTLVHPFKEWISTHIEK